MDIPNSILSSKLFQKISADEELKAQIISLRKVVEAFAATTTRSVPQFTDHTIRHMDALWSVTDEVLTNNEIGALTEAEAFILASGFYLHDIGMAYAATQKGLETIQASPTYRSFMSMLPIEQREVPGNVLRAVALAVRKLHANAAIDLATTAISGTDIYLFETKSFREAWGLVCGRVAASHHWDLEKIGREFGAKGVVPLPGNRRGNLQYIAGVLRIVDFAHINRDRASMLERAFRTPLDRDSLIHWLAQESVDGPVRDKNELVYHATSPIADVEAWWLYYEMLRGLDEEIRGVRRLFDRSLDVSGRLSLTGVRGAATPEEAAVLIPTDGFLPIEVNLRTGSIERLVELLAGKTLYGPNPTIAVRELLQNARDAVKLKSAIAVTDVDRAQQALPITVKLSTNSEPPTLEITDHGVGMSRTVMTDYLISIASDYWASQFASDFPDAAEAGFKPAGKFGIGFLSVFMLGDQVTVTSNRSGDQRYQLTLRGIGRRGELYKVAGSASSGTTIRIDLKSEVVERLAPLSELIKSWAPTFPHPISISVNHTETVLSEGWLAELSSGDFVKWLRRPQNVEIRPGFSFGGPQPSFFALQNFPRRKEFDSPWPLKIPEYKDGRTRLVAAFGNISLLCLKGLAVQPHFTPGFEGVVDLPEGATDVSRSRIEVDLSAILEKARRSVETQVQENLDAINTLVINETALLEQVVEYYGLSPLKKSSLRWLSLLKFPGETSLISCATLQEELRTAGSLFIAFNTGPWTALKFWADDRKAPPVNERAVLIDTQRHDLPYVSDKEAKHGALVEIWPYYKSAPLLRLVVSILSEEWSMDISDLVGQTGWTHSNSHLFGRFIRRVK